MTHHTHCDFHLGDNLVHLHFLRGLAKRYREHRFIHAVHACHIAQLNEVVDDLPNLHLCPLETTSTGSMDVWKNAGGCWENHALRNDYSGFYLEFFKYLASRMGLSSPFANREDLLFDYPKIQETVEILRPHWDFLVINSQPCSGQFLECRGDTLSLDLTIESLAKKWSVITTQLCSIPGVPCTQTFGLTISQIGALSLHCDNIVMISTGPSWPTFNIWNKDSVKFRLILADNEQLNLSKNTMQVRSTVEASAALHAKGFI